MEDDKEDHTSSDSITSLQAPGGLPLLHSKKAEALSDSVEPLNYPSDQAVIEMVN
jgi:hypothetical protein